MVHLALQRYKSRSLKADNTSVIACVLKPSSILDVSCIIPEEDTHPVAIDKRHIDDEIPDNKRQKLE